MLTLVRAKIFQSANAWAKLAERSPKYQALARQIISAKQVDAMVMENRKESRRYCDLLAKLPDFLVTTHVSSSRVEMASSIGAGQPEGTRARVHSNRLKVDDSWKPRLPFGVS